MTKRHERSVPELYGYDQMDSIIDFCYIANPYYPTGSMLADMQQMLPRLIKHYPSRDRSVCKENIETVFGVPREWLVVGNGAAELIASICRGRCVTMPTPGYDDYPTFAGGFVPYRIPRNENGKFVIDLNDYVEAIRSRPEIDVAVLINPHNPTGQGFDASQVRGFLEGVSHLDLVVLDESFADFNRIGYPIKRLHKHQNVIVVKSLSKHAGIPGLRLGIAYGSDIERYSINDLPTWNVNAMAEYFTELMVEHHEEYWSACERVKRDTQELLYWLQRVPGVSAYGSLANFVCCQLSSYRTAKELQHWLLYARKLYVRDCSSKQGMDEQHIRVATQDPASNSKLIEALIQFYAIQKV